jgi:hypothetical protein
VKLLARTAARLLGLLLCFILPACKPAQKSTANPATEDALVQQAATTYRQRIQRAASVHVANGKRMWEAKVLDMSEVTQREQLEPKREVVRQFLASNETLKSLLAQEEAVFQEELENLNVRQARSKAELDAFRSAIPAKEVNLRKRETDERIGEAMIGALDFLEGSWGQWNYSKEYSRVQFSQPGALAKYNEFMEAIEVASSEQKELQRQ